MKIPAIRSRTAAVFLAAATLPLGIFGSALAQEHHPAEKTAANHVDWSVYGGDPAGDHYSSLSQINRENVDRLRVAWTFDTGETNSGFESSPLIVNGVFYAPTPSGKVVALDAATGKRLWIFDSGVRGAQPVRGLSYWSGKPGPRIFVGDQNYLYAIDARTGKAVGGFGENGRVDLRKNLGRDYRTQSIALTTPGAIYKNLIIVGGELPETHPAPSGYIRAYDVRTGALRWTFHTIPQPGEKGYATWPKGAWKTAGGVNNWMGMVVDVRRGILYAPTGSAVFDFYGGDRVGNDLFADSLLALDAETGKLLWSFQGVHHDIWDRDFPSPPVLLSVRHGDRTVDAVAQATKQGYLYLFNRVTGRPLFPIVEERAPQSDVPGEVASPTQPKPLLPAPYARQILTEDTLTRRTPEAHAYALEKFKTFLGGSGPFVPFSLDRQTIVFPGFDGGAEWGGQGVDRETGILYINSNEMAWTGGLSVKAAGAGLGEKTYQQLCSICHGVDRRGSPPAFPSLIGIRAHLSDRQIEQTIASGKGRMPAFPALVESPTTMQALLRYLNSSASVTKHEMAAAPPLAAGPPAESSSGAEVYAGHCAVCHGDDRAGKAGFSPSLLGVSGRMNPTDITDLIHRGKGPMPAFPGIQNGDLQALLRYLGFGGPHSSAKTSSTGDINRGKYQFTGYRQFVDQDGYPAIQPPWGTLNAIDLNTGKYLWKIPLGEYPELAAEGLKNTGSENYGGPVVTAGGLVFIGATIFDKKIRAFDSRTGKLLWEATLPNAGAATPATYMAGGKQYVAIAAGGSKLGAPVEAKYVVFSLP